MSSPLYKKLKNSGSTFYTFPSTSMNPNPNFTKFVLLNIPGKIENGRLDFGLDNIVSNHPFGIYADGIAGNGTQYSEYLIESLRNYVANHDETMRNSRINASKDFYNIKEKQTPTEIIFWKWLKKMGAIEFEVAKHNNDYNKYLTDFDNKNAPSGTDVDYFRKYLWKEREVIDYVSNSIIVGIGDIVSVYISMTNVNFKIGDVINITLDNGNIVTSGSTLTNVVYDDGNNQSVLTFIKSGMTDISVNTHVKLNYNRLVQYVGEINVKSDVRTARKDETEVVAYIPHQAGRTPSVLFSTRFDTNYFPNLELPILPSQIQPEILGAENLDSPIRKNPHDYPGLYYGQFDTSNKTYTANTGDKMRYSGNYFGIKRTNNIGLSASGYTETVLDFDGDMIDGINIDFDLKHYYKMSLTNSQIGFNFDEFNQTTVDGVEPQDFEYNAILWYSEEKGNDVNDTNVYTNLYGITFLNTPVDGTTTIETYKKLVSNGSQDGLSYIHTLNMMTSVDNDISSLKFDPLTINNNFGFDLYQNVMSNVSKLNETFVNITNSFMSMNTDLSNMKSIIYTQTDMDMIKTKLNNYDQLLRLYEKYQFVDSETVSIVPSYSGVYPTLSFDVKTTEYSSLYKLNVSDIFKNSIDARSVVSVPGSNKLFIKVTNDYKIETTSGLTITLSNDLAYRQSVEFHIDANNAYASNNLKINMNYFDSVVGYNVESNLYTVYLPSDIGDNTQSSEVYNKSYYNSSTVSQQINLIETVDTNTLLYTSSQNFFGSNGYEENVFIDSFKFSDANGIVYDKSGMYRIGKTDNDFNQMYFKISLDTTGLTLLSTPIAYIVKKIKINIIRIDETDTSSITDRYLIEKIYI